MCERGSCVFFFFNDTATTEIYTFPTRRSSDLRGGRQARPRHAGRGPEQQGRAKGHADAGPGEAGSAERLEQQAEGQGEAGAGRSEEHTSELQSRQYLVCRLLLEKKKYRP